MAYKRNFHLFIWRKLGVKILGTRFIYTKKKIFYFELDNSIELFIYLIFISVFNYM